MLRRTTSRPTFRSPFWRLSATTSALALLVVVLPAPAAHAELSIEDAVWLTNHSYGTTVDDGDILAALERIGRNGGATVEEEDRRRLLGWAERIWKVRQTALDQVGDPYRYGGSGPHSFDCSGLTSFAWRSAGVELPHSSRSQASMTRSVPRSDLRVGDLLFYGSPVHHVAIYIGDGKVVEASRPGRPVRVSEQALRRSDLVKFGRVPS